MGEGLKRAAAAAKRSRQAAARSETLAQAAQIISKHIGGHRCGPIITRGPVPDMKSCAEIVCEEVLDASPDPHFRRRIELEEARRFEAAWNSCIGPHAFNSWVRDHIADLERKLAGLGEK